MKQRGRKSAAEREVEPLAGELERPDAPSELTADERREWRAIVERMPADWIKREHFGVLEAYCSHFCQRRRLAREASAQSLDTDEGLRRYDKLANAAERETRALLACARTLRLTHQAQYDAAKAFRGASKSPSGPRPWEYQ